MSAAALAAGLTAGLAGHAAAQDAARGKSLYFTHGCYGCHGFTGQTGVRNLVGTNSPNLATPEAFITFLRARSNVQPMTPSTSMPSFPARALPDPQARDLYAYIKTFKLDAPDPKDIPLYAQIQASAAKGYKGK
jgi:mono/diheme cytochrome c family protein